MQGRYVLHHHYIIVLIHEFVTIYMNSIPFQTGLGAELDIVHEIRREVTSHSQDSAYQHIPHLLTQLT